MPTQDRQLLQYNTLRPMLHICTQKICMWASQILGVLLYLSAKVGVLKCTAAELLLSISKLESQNDASRLSTVLPIPFPPTAEDLPGVVRGCGALLRAAAERAGWRRQRRGAACALPAPQAAALTVPSSTGCGGEWIGVFSNFCTQIASERMLQCVLRRMISGECHRKRCR